MIDKRKNVIIKILFRLYKIYIFTSIIIITHFKVYSYCLLAKLHYYSYVSSLNDMYFFSAKIGVLVGYIGMKVSFGLDVLI